MRKNKGYQQDIYKSCRRKERINSYARGSNLTLEQYINEENKYFDNYIKTCKEEYEKISTLTTLTNKELRKYCWDNMMWEVYFDDNDNLIPLEKAIEMIEKNRRKNISRRLYSNWSGYQKRIVNKDNQKFVYNTGGHTGHITSIRVPSLKRSNSVWKRFYELFPEAKGLKTFRGCKLKKI